MPLLLKNLIDQCLDADPLKWPTANELPNILNNWDNEVNYDKNTKFNKQVKEAEKFNQSSTPESNIVSPSYTTHPQAVYTSRLLNYKNLPEPQNSKEINIQFYTKFSGNLFWS